MAMVKKELLGAVLWATAFVCCEASERSVEGSRDPGQGGQPSEVDDGDTDSERVVDGPCANLETSNKGCEFWAVDLPNISKAPLAVMPENQQFAVVVANTSKDAPAFVRVYLGKGTSPIAEEQVPPYKIATIELPSENITPGVTSSDGKAFRITSDIPITAYQFNPLDNTSKVYSNDASLLFPSHVLSKDYTAITGSANLVAADGFSMSKLNTGGFVSVVATEDDTTVTLYPTKPLYPGSYQNVVLERGQVLTAIASGQKGQGNLSGTRVVADKNVAVFSGSVATSEPTATTKCCADHVEHQMLPLEAWGTAYALAPAAAAKGEGDHKSLYRLSAAYDGTEFRYLPQKPEEAPASLNAYETAEFVTKQPVLILSVDPDKPFSVTQFLLSNQMFKGLSISSYPGDPSMIVLPALDQFQTEYIFTVPHGYDYNYVTIVGSRSSQLYLDGEPVVEAFSALAEWEGIEYGYIHMPLSAGHHSLQSDEDVAIVVVGYSQDVSFGYPGGSGVHAIAKPPAPPV